VDPCQNDVQKRPWHRVSQVPAYSSTPPIGWLPAETRSRSRHGLRRHLKILWLFNSRRPPRSTRCGGARFGLLLLYRCLSSHAQARHRARSRARRACDSVTRSWVAAWSRPATPNSRTGARSPFPGVTVIETSAGPEAHGSSSASSRSCSTPARHHHPAPTWTRWPDLIASRRSGPNWARMSGSTSDSRASRSCPVSMLRCINSLMASLPAQIPGATGRPTVRKSSTANPTASFFGRKGRNLSSGRFQGTGVSGIPGKSSLTGKSRRWVRNLLCGRYSFSRSARRIRHPPLRIAGSSPFMICRRSHPFGIPVYSEACSRFKNTFRSSGTA